MEPNRSPAMNGRASKECARQCIGPGARVRRFNVSFRPNLSTRAAHELCLCINFTFNHATLWTALEEGLSLRVWDRYRESRGKRSRSIPGRQPGERNVTESSDPSHNKKDSAICTIDATLRGRTNRSRTCLRTGIRHQNLRRCTARERRTRPSCKCSTTNES